MQKSIFSYESNSSPTLIKGLNSDIKDAVIVPVIGAASDAF